MEVVKKTLFQKYNKIIAFETIILKVHKSRNIISTFFKYS